MGHDCQLRAVLLNLRYWLVPGLLVGSRERAAVGFAEHVRGVVSRLLHGRLLRLLLSRIWWLLGLLDLWRLLDLRLICTMQQLLDVCLTVQLVFDMCFALQ